MYLTRKRRSWHDAVAAHRRAVLGDVALHELDHCCSACGLVDRRSLDLVDQAARAVRALVPGVHGVEHGVALVNREHRALRCAGRAGPVTTTAISMMRSVSGSSPVISQVDPDQVLVASCCRRWFVRVFRASARLSSHAPGHSARGIVRATLGAPCTSAVLTLAFAARAAWPRCCVKFWLATRQMRHVAAHRDAVPPAFAARITLAAHQKAADYTLAKGRFGLLTMAFGAAILLGWTLLGGLDTAQHTCAMPSSRLGGGMAVPARAAGGLRAGRRPARPAVRAVAAPSASSSASASTA